MSSNILNNSVSTINLPQIPEHISYSQGFIFPDGSYLFPFGNKLFFKDTAGIDYEINALIKNNEHYLLSTDGNDENENTINLGHSPNLKSISDSVLIGHRIGKDCNTDFHDNVVQGIDCLSNTSVIGGNVAIGNGVLGSCGKVTGNIGIGKDTLKNCHDDFNLAAGFNCASDIKSKIFNHNIILGKDVLSESSGMYKRNIIQGTSALKNSSGSIFQSIFIGDLAGLNHHANEITINATVIGTNAGRNTTDIIDTTLIGSNCGENGSFRNAVGLGVDCLINTKGITKDVVSAGRASGRGRVFDDVENSAFNVYVGSEAGSTTKNLKAGINNTLVGAKCGTDMDGSNNSMYGVDCGIDFNGSYCMIFGNNSGKNCKGKNQTIYGFDNLINGNNSSIYGRDNSILNTTNVLLYGNNNKIKYNVTDATLFGDEIAKDSVGHINDVVIIGKECISGIQNSADNSPQRLTVIGNRSLKGDKLNPQLFTAQDLVVLGTEAASSDEAIFKKSLILGNFAGSYAKRIIGSVIMGHNAAIGMDGEDNVIVGEDAAISLKGSRNIIVGKGVADSIPIELNDTVLLGYKNKVAIQKDIKTNNLNLGDTLIQDWNGISDAIILPNGAVLNKSNGGLMYRDTIKSQPTAITSGKLRSFLYKTLNNQTKKNVYSITFKNGSNGGFLLCVKIASSSSDSSYSSQFIGEVKNNIPIIHTDHDTMNALAYKHIVVNNSLQLLYNGSKEIHAGVEIELIASSEELLKNINIG